VIDRRAFILGVTLSLPAAPVAAEANRQRRCIESAGWISVVSRAPTLHSTASNCYGEGANVIFDYRVADGHPERDREPCLDPPAGLRVRSAHLSHEGSRSRLRQLEVPAA